MGMDVGTGWERDNRMHFDEIVVNYDKVRWDYPDELFTDAIQYSGQGNGKQALEIGAGTGKATTPFLDAGYAVTAVEMGANMTEFLRDRFKQYSNFDVITSTFEDVQLENDSYDLIYAASAFHWVDSEIGCSNVLRLLKNGGAFILFRNIAVPVHDDELYTDVQAVYEKHYYSWHKLDNRPIKISKMTEEDFRKPSEIHRGFRFESLEQYGFLDITMKLYEAARAYSADEYIALLETYSDHRALPNGNRAALYAGIKKAIMKHGGQQKLNFIFQLYMGRKDRTSFCRMTSL
jgi:SAM-dependent methyltransferase